MTDIQVDRNVKLQGTDYDRRRKLTTNDINYIRRLYKSGKSIVFLAKKFNVTYPTIKYHVDPEARARAIKLRNEYPASYVNHAEQFESRVAYKRSILAIKG